MINKKKWLDKYASPEGSIKVLGTHDMTTDEKNRFEDWKIKVNRKYSLSSSR